MVAIIFVKNDQLRNGGHFKIEPPENRGAICDQTVSLIKPTQHIELGPVGQLKNQILQQKIYKFDIIFKCKTLEIYVETEQLAEARLKPKLGETYPAFQISPP